MRERLSAAVPYGDRALRFEPGNLESVHRLAEAVRTAGIPGVTDVVPAWSTVVVHVDDPARRDEVAVELSGLSPAAVARPRAEHVLPVRYDGEDLPRVAAIAGLPPEEVVGRHAAGRYVVAFLGFTPGFPYLAGLDPALAAPRLDTPRQRVAAGSVGIADGVTGVYPTASPGGWNIVGRTDAVLFDPASADPARFAPGDIVRFRPV